MAYTLTRSEAIHMYLCYIIGMGLILFGALSGNHYGYLFVIIGALALVLMIIRAIRKEAQYNENIMIKNS